MWTDFRILEFNNNTYQGNGKAPIETLTHDEIERMRKVNNDPAMLSLVWKPNLFIGNFRRDESYDTKIAKN